MGLRWDSIYENFIVVVVMADTLLYFVLFYLELLCLWFSFSVIYEYNRGIQNWDDESFQLV